MRPSSRAPKEGAQQEGVYRSAPEEEAHARRPTRPFEG